MSLLNVSHYAVCIVLRAVLYHLNRFRAVLCQGYLHRALWYSKHVNKRKMKSLTITHCSRTGITKKESRYEIRVLKGVRGIDAVKFAIHFVIFMRAAVLHTRTRFIVYQTLGAELLTILKTFGKTISSHVCCMRLLLLLFKRVVSTDSPPIMFRHSRQLA